MCSSVAGDWMQPHCPSFGIHRTLTRIQLQDETAIRPKKCFAMCPIVAIGIDPRAWNPVGFRRSARIGEVQQASDGRERSGDVTLSSYKRTRQRAPRSADPAPRSRAFGGDYRAAKSARVVCTVTVVVESVARIESSRGHRSGHFAAPVKKADAPRKVSRSWFLACWAALCGNYHDDWRSPGSITCRQRRLRVNTSNVMP